MSKRGRKGRVSNELVAASFAAILSVYAAGYWRTRDEARRLEDQGQMRRPMPAAPVSSAGAAIKVATPTPVASAPVPEASPAATPIPTKVNAAEDVSPARASMARAAVPAERKADAAPGFGPAPEPAPVPTTMPESAPAPVPAADTVLATAETEAAPAEVLWRDGYYTGWGQSYHGDIEARVTIKDGRIVEAGIATCATRYPCYVIDSILNQPVARQSPDVDRVSRATESADAYYWGLVKALKKAEADPAAAATSP